MVPFAVAGLLEDKASTTLAYSLMGISLHLSGELARAQASLEAALRYGPRSDRTTIGYLGFDGRILAGAILARTLWLQGYSDQAVARALATVKDAEDLQHPLTLSIALVWAASLFLWLGDLDQADQCVQRLVSRAAPHALGPYLAVGDGFSGELAIRRGSAEQGVEALRRSLQDLDAAPYALLTTPLTIALIQGLGAMGRLSEALALLDDTILSVETAGDLCYMPELLRLKAGVAHPSRPASEAEAFLRQSIAMSRAQGARAWELRSATDLAAGLDARGEREEARNLLRPLIERFAEGLETPDLKASTRLLATLMDAE